MTGSLLHEPAGEARRIRAAPSSRSTTAPSSATATCAASAPGSCSSRASSSPTSARALGEEPLVAAFTAKGARRAARRPPRAAEGRAPRPAHARGAGNIYVDEALWYARLHPLRAGGLARPRRAAPPAPRRSARALELGIARQGSTLTDYRLPDGERGLDAARVQGLRPRRRAVRPLRHADRERSASAAGAPGSARPARCSTSGLRRRRAPVERAVRVQPPTSSV